MATRWCGELKIVIRIDQSDREGWLYRCTVSAPRCECTPKCELYRGQVRLAPADREQLAEDNPIAFDKIAHAVMSFATNDDKNGNLTDHAHATVDANYWIISRRDLRKLA